jgi:hypothetical protein
MIRTALAATALIALTASSFAQDAGLTAGRLSGKAFATRILSDAWVSGADALDTDISVHGGLLIRFLPDGKYRGILGAGQGGEKQIEGNYTIAGGRLTLNRMNRPWLTNGTMTCDTSELKYPCSLRFGNDINKAADEILGLGFNFGWGNRLYDLSSRAAENMVTRVNGVEAVTTGCRKGITTDAVNLRKRPSATAEKCEFFGDPVKQDKTSVLKKNSEILVLAKTPRKDSVGRWENHWYYIEFTDARPDQELIRAWAFGEFIRITGK